MKSSEDDGRRKAAFELLCLSLTRESLFFSLSIAYCLTPLPARSPSAPPTAHFCPLPGSGEEEAEEASGIFTSTRMPFSQLQSHAGEGGGGLKFVQGWLSHPPPALQPCLYYLNTFVLGMQFTKLHPDFLQGGRFSPGTILGGPYHLMWCHYPLNHIWLEATGTQLSWHCSHLPPFAAKSFLTLWNMIH